MAEPEDESQPVLLPCSICARTFKPESLAKHTKVCEKQITKKRKIFDSSKQRIQGTELAEFLPTILLEKKSEKVAKKKPESKWKEKHLEFVRAIRAARGVESELPKSSSTLQAPRSSNHEKCPHCDRNFGPKAFDRHIEWCKEQKARIPKSPASLQAKERLEARTKYRAPPLAKSKRTLTREKYSRTSQNPSHELSPMGSRSAIAFTKTPQAQSHDVKAAEASTKTQGGRNKPKLSTSSSSCALVSGNLQIKRREPSPSPSRRIVRSGSKTPKKDALKNKKEEITSSDCLFSSPCSITKMQPSNERFKGKEGKNNPTESRLLTQKIPLAMMKTQERKDDQHKSQIPVIDIQRMRCEGQNRACTYLGSGKEMHQVNKTRSLPGVMCFSLQNIQELGCGESTHSIVTVDSHEGETLMSYTAAKRLTPKGHTLNKNMPKLNDIDVNANNSGLTVSPCSFVQSSNLITWKEIAGKRNSKESGTDLENNVCDPSFSHTASFINKSVLTNTPDTEETVSEVHSHLRETDFTLDPQSEYTVEPKTDCCDENIMCEAELVTIEHFSKKEQSYITENREVSFQVVPMSCDRVKCDNMRCDDGTEVDIMDCEQSAEICNMEQFMELKNFPSIVELNKFTKVEELATSGSELLDSKEKTVSENKCIMYSQENAHFVHCSDSTDQWKNVVSQSNCTGINRFMETDEIECSKLNFVTEEMARPKINDLDSALSMMDSEVHNLITVSYEICDNYQFATEDKTPTLPNSLSEHNPANRKMVEEIKDVEANTQEMDKQEHNVKNCDSVVLTEDFEAHTVNATIEIENKNFLYHKCKHAELPENFNNAGSSQFLDCSSEIDNYDEFCGTEMMIDSNVNNSLPYLKTETNLCNFTPEGCKSFILHSSGIEPVLSAKNYESNFHVYDSSTESESQHTDILENNSLIESGHVDENILPLCRKSCFCCFEKNGISRIEAYTLWQKHKNKLLCSSRKFNDIYISAGTEKYTSESTVDRIWDLASEEFIKTVKENSLTACNSHELSNVSQIHGFEKPEAEEEQHVPHDSIVKRTSNQWKTPLPNVPVLFKATYSFRQYKRRVNSHRRHSFALYRVRKKHRKKVNNSVKTFYEWEEPQVKKRLLHEVSAISHHANLFTDMQKEPNGTDVIKNCSFSPISFYCCYNDNNDVNSKNESKYIFGEQMLTNFDKKVQKRMLLKTESTFPCKNICSSDNSDLLHADKCKNENNECHKMYFDSTESNIYMKAAYKNLISQKILQERHHGDFTGKERATSHINETNFSLQQWITDIFKCVTPHMISRLLYSSNIGNTMLIKMCFGKSSVQKNLYNFKKDENLTVQILLTSKVKQNESTLHINETETKEYHNIIPSLYDSSENHYKENNLINLSFVCYDTDEKVFSSENEYVLKKLIAIEDVPLIGRETNEDQRTFPESAHSNCRYGLQLSTQHLTNKRSAECISSRSVDNEIIDIKMCVFDPQTVKLRGGDRIVYHDLYQEIIERFCLNDASNLIPFTMEPLDNTHLKYKLCLPKCIPQNHGGRGEVPLLNQHKLRKNSSNNFIVQCNLHDNIVDKQEYVSLLKDIHSSSLKDLQVNSFPRAKCQSSNARDFDIETKNEFFFESLSMYVEKVAENSKTYDKEIQPLQHCHVSPQMLSQDCIVKTMRTLNEGVNSVKCMNLNERNTTSSIVPPTSSVCFHHNELQQVLSIRGQFQSRGFISINFPSFLCDEDDCSDIQVWTSNFKIPRKDITDVFQSLHDSSNKSYRDEDKETLKKFNFSERLIQSMCTLQKYNDILFEYAEKKQKCNVLSAPYSSTVASSCKYTMKHSPKKYYNCLQEIKTSKFENQAMYRRQEIRDNSFNIVTHDFVCNFRETKQVDRIILPKISGAELHQKSKIKSAKEHNVSLLELVEKWTTKEKIIRRLKSAEETTRKRIVDYSQYRQPVPKIQRLPPLSALPKYSLHSSSSEEVYNPYKSAERQMMELLSQGDFVHQKSQQKTIPSHTETSPVFPSFESSHRSAFVRYSPQELPHLANETVIPSSLIAEFEDLFIAGNKKSNCVVDNSAITDEPNQNIPITLSSIGLNLRNNNVEVAQPNRKPSKIRAKMESAALSLQRSVSIMNYENDMKIGTEASNFIQSDEDSNPLPVLSEFSFPFSSPEPPSRAFSSAKSHLEKGDADKKTTDEKFASKSEASVGSDFFAQSKCHSAGGKFSADSAYGSLNRRSPVISGSQISGKNDGDIGEEQRLCFMSSSSSESSLPPLCTVQVVKHDASNPSVTPTSSPVVDSSPVSQTLPRMSKFCHECGSKYPVSLAKFCCECGVRRLAM